MKPLDAVIELLERLGAAPDGQVYVGEVELRDWPSQPVAALKQQKLLARARPAKSVVCPGCERACAMAVHTVSRADGKAASFVVCDKRDDINRVAIPDDLLKQWRCDTLTVGEFIAASLQIRPSEQKPAGDSLLPIGTFKGKKQRQVLCLRVDERVALVAGDKSEPLADLVAFENGRFGVDAEAIRRIVDSATTVDPAYTPSVDRREERKQETRAMYAAWRKAYRAQKKRRPHMSAFWYAQQIAKLPIARGRDVGTIRKNIKI
ncbi:MAG: hypothetical protein FJ145_03415 [Deltaproteobacteria bacterium]|nr:hypothetical protein [Deltaproteobacteria bacterium]